MANSNPSPSTRFKVGHPGGPGKPICVLTKPRVQSVMGRLSEMTRSELQELVSNPNAPMLEIMVAAVMVKIAKEGDHNKFSFLLDRTIGKVVDQIEISEFESMSTTELIQIVKEKLPEIG